MVLSVFMLGCGYSTKSLLPTDIKNVHVPPVKNSINLTAEINDKSPFRAYRPGLEVDLTNAIINRFIFDGNLKISPKEKADAVVEATLVDYRRDPLRYSTSDDVQEYRLSITLDVAVSKTRDHKTLWAERVTGDTTFFLAGANALSEDDAAAKAVDDVARRVVEKTIDVW
jgi:hypothetical protein